MPGKTNQQTLVGRTIAGDVKHITGTANVTLEAWERNVVAANSGNIVVTLPPPETVEGAEFYLYCNTTFDVAIADRGTTLCTPTAAADEAFLKSVGFKWIVLTQTIGGTRS